MEVKLGIKENWKQFFLLVLINAFVGGMVGLERTVLPLMASEEFGIVAATAAFSFIISFGLSKAFANYFAGRLTRVLSKKWTLTLGWLIGIPVPFMIIGADTWNMIVFANVLLGINQGLTWSSAVMMKVDLASDSDRGLAMGLNEFAGYLSVGVLAFISAGIAYEYGYRPFPFYLGIGMSVIGFLLSLIFVKDTKSHVDHAALSSGIPLLKNIFWETTFRHRNLGSVTQAGLINNLNDGMVWGALPILLLTRGIGEVEIGLIAGIYPAIWGISQLLTGRLADKYSRKKLLFIGMISQGLVLPLYIFDLGSGLILVSVLLGIGTALVYPTFLVAIAENSHPSQRAEAIGAFRLWRDLGYVLGAILAGVIADQFGIEWAFIIVGILTLSSGVFLQVRMREFKSPVS